MAPKVQQDEDEDYEEAAGGTPAQREADQQIFSVSKKTAEHCIDFDLKKCLNQSFCEFNENYTRAGVVTYAATVIFGKAVDYVFDEGCAMRERLREKNAVSFI